MWHLRRVVFKIYDVEEGIHVASMDAVFKISQTTYRDRIIRAKNSLKEFFAFIC